MCTDVTGEGEDIHSTDIYGYVKLVLDTVLDVWDPEQGRKTLLGNNNQQRKQTYYYLTN